MKARLFMHPDDVAKVGEEEARRLADEAGADLRIDPYIPKGQAFYMTAEACAYIDQYQNARNN